jgi:hypothetical protein
LLIWALITRDWAGTLSTVPKVATTPHGWTCTGDVGMRVGMGVGTGFGARLQAAAMKHVNKSRADIRNGMDG